MKNAVMAKRDIGGPVFGGYRFVSSLRLCRINRVHLAMRGSLSSGSELVTWIFGGVIVPVETDGRTLTPLSADCRSMI